MSSSGGLSRWEGLTAIQQILPPAETTKVAGRAMLYASMANA